MRSSVARLLLRSATTTRHWQQSFYSSRKNVLRFFTTSNDPKPPPPQQQQQQQQEEESTPQPSDAQLLLASTAKGAGQVIFLNSKESGLIVFGSLAVADPFLASMGLLGTSVSNVAAHFGGLDRTTLTNGLYSYNGCLVGCVAATFMPGLAPTLGVTVLGAAASTAATVALSRSMETPQWTIAFNMVALTCLLPLRPLAATTDAITTTTTSTDLLLSPLTGLSQIFLVESAVTGAGLLAATAYYSPQLAGYALLGSTTGALVGALVGADPSHGLWGYNAALTSLGVGVFFVRSPQSMGLAVGGAAATAVVFGAMLGPVSSSLQCPVLTVPFCLTMTGCYLLGSPRSESPAAVPGLVLADAPHSPEQNGSLE